MAIRGTAVLVEIDFDVPGQGGAPDAKFQVLVEPDGTTGSYILYDKTTLAPIATVNQAGQQINISQGVVSQTLSGLSTEVQKLITEVFAQKFTDTTNTKTFDHFTDTPVPISLTPIILAEQNDHYADHRAGGSAQQWAGYKFKRADYHGPAHQSGADRRHLQRFGGRTRGRDAQFRDRYGVGVVRLSMSMPAIFRR